METGLGTVSYIDCFLADDLDSISFISKRITHSENYKRGEKKAFANFFHFFFFRIL